MLRFQIRMAVAIAALLAAPGCGRDSAPTDPTVASKAGALRDGVIEADDGTLIYPVEDDDRNEGYVSMPPNMEATSCPATLPISGHLSRVRLHKWVTVGYVAGEPIQRDIIFTAPVTLASTEGSGEIITLPGAKYMRCRYNNAGGEPKEHDWEAYDGYLWLDILLFYDPYIGKLRFAEAWWIRQLEGVRFRRKSPGGGGGGGGDDDDEAWAPRECENYTIAGNSVYCEAFEGDGEQSGPGFETGATSDEICGVLELGVGSFDIYIDGILWDNVICTSAERRSRIRGLERAAPKPSGPQVIPSPLLTPKPKVAVPGGIGIKPLGRWPN